MNESTINQHATTIGVFSLVFVLTIVSLIVNSLVLAVLLSTERLAKRVACLFYLCSSLLYTTIIGIIQSFMMLYAETTNADLGQALKVIMALLNSADMITCSAVVVLTFDQYLYIEKPLSHDRFVTKAGLLGANIGLTVLCITVGIIPVYVPDESSMFTGLIFCMCWTGLSAVLIAAMYIRMLCIAQHHRAKIQQVEKTHRCDSLFFFAVILVTIFISFLIPGLLHFFSVVSPNYITPFYLVAGVVFPLAYGSRFPRGLLQSIKMTVCYCFPVETNDPTKSSLQVETAMRLAMMRLGRTMIRIDEQSAVERHQSFMRTKASLKETFTIRGSRFSSTPSQNKPAKRVASLFAPWMRGSSLLSNGTHENLTKSRSDASTLEKNTAQKGKRVTWHPVALSSPIELGGLPKRSEDVFSTGDETMRKDNPKSCQDEGSSKKVGWKDDGSDVSSSTPLNTEVELVFIPGSRPGSDYCPGIPSDSTIPANLSIMISTDHHPEPKLSPLPGERENSPCVLRAAYPQRSLSPLPTLKKYENRLSRLSVSSSESELNSI